MLLGYKCIELIHLLDVTFFDGIGGGLGYSLLDCLHHQLLSVSLGSFFVDVMVSLHLLYVYLGEYSFYPAEYQLHWDNIK